MWTVFLMDISMVQVTFLEAGPVMLRCDGTRSWVASQRPHTVAVALPNLTAPYLTCLDAHVPHCAYVPPSTSNKRVLRYKKQNKLSEHSGHNLSSEITCWLSFLCSWVCESWINVNNCPTRCDYIQFYYISANSATCFGWYFHPSSGAHVKL